MIECDISDLCIPGLRRSPNQFGLAVDGLLLQAALAGLAGAAQTS